VAGSARSPLGVSASCSAPLLAARVDFIAFSLPVGSLIAFVVAAWVVGLVAAIFPARRASGLRPVEALSHERPPRIAVE
jgi:ABC-type lipoprotein release transport system permease subunit